MAVSVRRLCVLMSVPIQPSPAYKTTLREPMALWVLAGSLNQRRGLVWQLLSAGSPWRPLRQTCGGQVCASPTFPSPTRRTGAMDSFAELRELMSLFHSGVLARDSHRICRRWGAGRTSARRRRHEPDGGVAEELEACWTTTNRWTRAPFLGYATWSCWAGRVARQARSCYAGRFLRGYRSYRGRSYVGRRLYCSQRFHFHHVHWRDVGTGTCRRPHDEHVGARSYASVRVVWRRRAPAG